MVHPIRFHSSGRGARVPVGYVDGLFELVDFLVHMVQRREALLSFHCHQLQPQPQPSPPRVALVISPPAEGRRDRQVPTGGRGGGGRGKDRGARSRSRDRESRVQETSSSLKRTLTGDDTETRDTEETVGDHFESEGGEDDIGTESHSFDDIGLDGDSDTESCP